jgi:hypothetical protein
MGYIAGIANTHPNSRKNRRDLGTPSPESPESPESGILG